MWGWNPRRISLASVSLQVFLKWFLGANPPSSKLLVEQGHSVTPGREKNQHILNAYCMPDTVVLAWNAFSCLISTKVLVG